MAYHPLGKVYKTTHYTGSLVGISLGEKLVAYHHPFLCQHIRVEMVLYILR